MDYLFLDFETRSKRNIEDGVSRYARDRSTEALMLSWAVNDDPIEQVVFAEGQTLGKDLLGLLRDPSVRKQAWNAAFELTIFEHVLQIPMDLHQWFCTMAWAMSLGIPGKLEKAGQVIKLPEEYLKMAEGRALIRRFCTPNAKTKTFAGGFRDRTTDPEAWETFKLYNRRDVAAERAIFRRIRRWPPLDSEIELWRLDRRINEAGLPINLRMVDNACTVIRDELQHLLGEQNRITRLANSNSATQLLPWAQSRGYPFNDLQKGHIRKALEDEALSGQLRRVLELRKQSAKTSVKKYHAIQRAVDADGRLRNTIQFLGALRTGRFAGRILQGQNLARPVKALEKDPEYSQAVRDVGDLSAAVLSVVSPAPVMDTLSSCVRGSIQAPEGQALAVADLNAIENRVLGWLADEPKILQVFAAGRCPYLDFATYIYDKPYSVLEAEYKAGDKTKRTVAKPGVLGCGYMLSKGQVIEDPKTGEVSATGLLGYAWDMGVRLTPEQAELSVKVFRATYTKVVDWWWALDKAARLCIASHEPQAVGEGARRVIFDIDGPFMRILLPSGRRLHYCRPALEMCRMPWGDYHLGITYEGLNERKQWVRLNTHPGKLAENIDQAVSRDILAHGLVQADRRGIEVVLHVHDEIVSVTDGSAPDQGLHELIECMEQVPSWAPGLPLKAAGYVSWCYRKD